MELWIGELLDYQRSVDWIIKHFHPDGFKCPDCGASVNKAREFRRTKCSQLVVYRCRCCETAYNLYTGTIFQQRHLTPIQAVMFVRGVCNGESTNILAAKLNLNYKMTLTLRHEIQSNGERFQPDSPSSDQQSDVVRTL